MENYKISPYPFQMINENLRLFHCRIVDLKGMSRWNIMYEYVKMSGIDIRQQDK